MISAVSAPTQAKELDAGLTKHLKISHRGLKRKVFPQFAGPTINRFLYLPLPFSSSSFTDDETELFDRNLIIQ